MVRRTVPLLMSFWVLILLLSPVVVAGPASQAAAGQARAAQVRQNTTASPGKSAEAQAVGKQARGKAETGIPTVAASGSGATCLKGLRGWRVAGPEEISTLRSARLMTVPSCTKGGGLDWSERAALAGNAVLARYFEVRGLPLQTVVGVIVRSSGEAAIIIAK